MNKRYYSPNELMQLLGLSRNTVYKYLADGTVRSVRMGQGKYRIPAAEMKRLQVEQSGEIQPVAEEVNTHSASEPRIMVREAETPKVHELKEHQEADLYDWMVAMLSLVQGMGMSLFNYYDFAVAQEWQVFQFAFMPYVLIAYGFLAVVSTAAPVKSKIHKYVDLMGVVVFAGLAMVIWPLKYIHAITLYIAIAVSMLIGLVWPAIDGRDKFGLTICLKLIGVAVLYGLAGPETYQNLIPGMTLPVYMVVGVTLIVACVFGLLYRWTKNQDSIGANILSYLAGGAYLFIGYVMVQFGLWDRVLAFLTVGSFIMFVPRYKTFEITWVRSRREVAVETAGIMISIMIVGLLVGAVNNKYNVDVPQASVKTDSRVVVSAVDSFLLQAKNELAAIASSRLILSAFSTGDTKTLTELLRDDLQTVPSLMQVLIIDLEGKVIDYYPKTDELQVSNVGFREYFKEAGDGRIYVTSKMFKARLPGDPWAMGISAPMYGDGGDLVGVVAARLNLDYFQKTLSDLKDTNADEYSLIDESGRVIASTDPKVQYTVSGEDFEKSDQLSPGAIPLVAAFSEQSSSLKDRSGWEITTEIKQAKWYAKIRHVDQDVRLTESVMVATIFVAVIIILTLLSIWRYHKMGQIGTNTE